MKRVQRLILRGRHGARRTDFGERAEVAAILRQPVHTWIAAASLQAFNEKRHELVSDPYPRRTPAPARRMPLEGQVRFQHLKGWNPCG